MKLILHNFENFSKHLKLLFFIYCFSHHLYSYDLVTYDFLEHHHEIENQELYYTPFPESKSQSLLPLCFLAHILEKLSYFLSAYIIFTAGLQLKENLHQSNNRYWPIAWFVKCGYWGRFGFTITSALAKVLLLRWGAKLIINATCPEELKKVKPQNQYQTKQVKTKSI